MATQKIFEESLPTQPLDAEQDADSAPPRGSVAYLKRIVRLMADLPGLLFGAGGEAEAATDAGINAALARVGEFLATSRAYVMLDEEGGRFLRNTHEWVNRNVGPAMSSWPLHDYKRDIPSLKPLMEGKPFFAAHTNELPPDMREVLSKQAVDSVLLVPLLQNGAWIGLIGLDSCGGEREWREEEVDVTRHLAGLVVPSLERRDYQSVRARLERIRVALNEVTRMPEAKPPPAADGDATLVGAERQLIVDTLARHHGNRGSAAKQLGITWAALDRRCKKLGIPVARRTP